MEHHLEQKRHAAMYKIINCYPWVNSQQYRVNRVKAIGDAE